MLLPPVPPAFAAPADAPDGPACAAPTEEAPTGVAAEPCPPVEVAPAGRLPGQVDLGRDRLAVDLHPVGWHYGVRYQRLLADTMGGRGAPASLGPTVAEADVYWRLATWETPDHLLDADAPARWRDTAVAGAVLAVNRLVDETLERAPQLAAYRAVLDAVVNPNLSVRREDERVTVRHLTGGRRQRRLEEAELTLTPEPDRAPQPSFGVGVDWKLRDEEDPPRTPLLGYGVWLSTTNLGLSNLRADVSLIRPEWTLTARQKVYPRVYLYTNLASAPREWLPGRVAAGAMWSLPWTAGWSLKLERSAQLDAPGVRWMATLRGELHTPIPAREDLPLGEGGLCFPDLPDRDPNELAPLNPPSVERPGPEGCDRRF